MSQGKLVRDNIPRIIRSQGLEPVTYTAGTDEYGTRLRDKLREEVGEFLASRQRIPPIGHLPASVRRPVTDFRQRQLRPWERLRSGHARLAGLADQQAAWRASKCDQEAVGEHQALLGPGSGRPTPVSAASLVQRRFPARLPLRGEFFEQLAPKCARETPDRAGWSRPHEPR